MKKIDLCKLACITLLGGMLVSASSTDGFARAAQVNAATGGGLAVGSSADVAGLGDNEGDSYDCKTGACSQECKDGYTEFCKTHFHPTKFYYKWNCGTGGVTTWCYGSVQCLPKKKSTVASGNINLISDGEASEALGCGDPTIDVNAGVAGIDLNQL